MSNINKMNIINIYKSVFIHQRGGGEDIKLSNIFFLMKFFLRICNSVIMIAVKEFS